MGDFEDHSIRQRQVDIGFTAAKVLMGAIRGDTDCVDETLKVPPEAWPDVWGPVAGAVHAVIDAGNKPDHCTVTRAMQDAKVPRGNLLVGEIEQITGHDHSLQPDLDCAAILREYSSRDAANKLGLISEIAAKGDLEAARHAFGDLAPFEFVPAPADPLPIADWRNAGDIPESLFYNGIYRARYSLMGGASNAGKSYLALMAGISLATGRKMIEPFAPRKRGRVLMLSGEDDAAVIKQRALDTAKRYNVDLDGAPIDFVDQVSPLIEFDSYSTATFTPAWKSLEKQCANYDLVIIDPLAAWFAVNAENPGGDLSKIGNALAELAKRTGAAILLTHHTSKQGTFTLSQNSLRGHTGLYTPSRWIAIIARPSDSDLGNWGKGKESAVDYLRFVVDKNSYGPNTGAEIVLRRGHGGVLEDSDVKADRYRDIAQALQTILREDEDLHLTEREIIRGNGGLAKQVQAAVDDLVGKTKGPDRERGIKVGIDAGMLEIREISTKGKPRREVCAKC